MTTPITSPKQFEKSLTQLESIVEKMESEELSLTESLKLYEQGVKLTQHCQTALAHAEQQVEIINQEITASTTPSDITTGTLDDTAN